VYYKAILWKSIDKLQVRVRIYVLNTDIITKMHRNKTHDVPTNTCCALNKLTPSESVYPNVTIGPSKIFSSVRWSLSPRTQEVSRWADEIKHNADRWQRVHFVPDNSILSPILRYLENSAILKADDKHVTVGGHMLSSRALDAVISNNRNYSANSA